MALATVHLLYMSAATTGTKAALQGVAHPILIPTTPFVWVGPDAATALTLSGSGKADVIASATVVLGTKHGGAIECLVNICAMQSDKGSGPVYNPKSDGQDSVWSETTLAPNTRRIVAANRLLTLDRGHTYTIGVCINIVSGMLDFNGKVSGFVMVV